LGQLTPVLRFRIRKLRRAARDAVLKFRAQTATGLEDLSPQILGIGAARSATGWLHRRLSEHPDLYLPRIKELHFFDTRDLDQLKNELQWKMYWLHFTSAGNRMRAEVTPAYSMLPEEKIEIVAQRMPATRIIYFMRDPIERAWSGLRYRLWYGRGLKASQLTDQELMSYIKDEALLAKGNYWDNIRRWLAFYPDSQMFFGLYDEVVLRPADLLERLCRFLGIDAAPILQQKDYEQRVNAVPATNIPAFIKDPLRDYYQAQVDDLKVNLGLNVENWLK